MHQFLEIYFILEYTLHVSDGKTNRNAYSIFQNKVNFKKLVHLVGFTIEIYYDARPYEHQMLRLC
jgi:hypothetical protein